METTITLKNQNNLFISGLEKVVSISPTEVIIEIDGKKLIILGENMEIQTLDLENKIFIVNGLVCSMKYSGQKQKFLKRIFK